MRANVNLMYENTAQTSGNVHKISKKRVKSRRILSLFLTLSMVASFFVLPEFSAQAATAPWQGSGTAADPYIIATAADLTALANNTTTSYVYRRAYYKQTANISTNSSFVPIGSAAIYAFEGVYDGQMYTITHTKTYSDIRSVGVFGFVNNGGIVKNLRVNGTLTSSGSSVEFTGGIAGRINNNAKIVNCQFLGTIHSASESTGGIVGLIYSGGGVVRDCRNSGVVNGAASNLGGIVGEVNDNDAEVTYCNNIGKVKATVSGFLSIGGIVGCLHGGAIRFCYSEGGEVSGTNANGNVGGIVGSVSQMGNDYQNQQNYVEYCWNSTPISGGTRVGGIAGQFNDASMRMCYSTSKLTGVDMIGGLVGTYSDATMESCFVPVVDISASSSSKYPYVGSVIGHAFDKEGVSNVGYGINVSSPRVAVGNAASDDEFSMSGFTTIFNQLGMDDWIKNHPAFSTQSGQLGLRVNGNIEGTVTSGSKAQDWTYDGTAHSLMATSGRSATGDNLYSIDGENWYQGTTLKATNAGTYTVYFKTNTATSSNNPTCAQRQEPQRLGFVTVRKVTPTATITKAEDWTYDSTSHSLIKSATTNYGTIYYYNNTTGTAPASTTTGSTTKPSVTAAGTHHIWYRIAGNSNVNDVGWTKVGTVTVSKAAGTLTLSKSSYTKTLSETAADNTFSLGATGSGGTLTYESSDPTRVTVDANGNATVIKPGNATITVKLVGDDNHTSDEKTIAISINGTVPGAASNLSANPGNNQIRLLWDAPKFNGGYALTGYTIMRKAANEGIYKSIATVTDLDTTYVDTTVVNGTSYSYRLYAKNAEGTATKYAEVGCTPFTTSGPVYGLTSGVEVSKRLAFWWYTPQNTGGATPSNYKVTITRGDGTEYLSKDTGTETSVEVTTDFTKVFKPGEKLTAAVVPFNFAGWGESASYTLTLPNIPGAPKDFRTSPDAAGTIAAYWSEGDTDSYPITKYTVSYRKHGSGEEFTNVELTDLAAIRDMVEEGSESVIGSKKYKYVITGLETGVVYDVKVTASNLGYTSETTKVLEQICAGRPSAPVIDGDMITKDQGVFAKEVSAEPNGGDITEYVFYARLTEDGAEAPFEEFARVKADRNGKLVNVYAKGELVNGKNYDVCVSAVNVAGEGAKSDVQTLIVGYPSVVQNIHITPKAGSVMNITFDPSDGNGRPIDHYELMIGGTVNGKTQEVVTIKTNAEETKNTTYDFFSGDRVNGDEITLQIVAVTKFSLTQEGKSIPSEKITSRIGAPSAPKLTSNETDETGVAIEWTESATNGNAMLYYTVYITDITSTDNQTVHKFKTANADAESLHMTIAKGAIDETGAYTTFDNNGEPIKLLTKYQYPFVDGHKYRVSVTATNRAGEGDASNEGVFTFAAPAEPQDVVVTPEDGKLTVAWSAPANDGGYKIIGYNIYLNDDKNPTMKVEWAKMVNGVEVSDEEAPEATTAPDPEATEAPADVVTYQLKVTDFRKGASAKPENYGDGQDNIDRFEVVIGDLANGYSYTATVKAINESGEGAGSNNTEPETPRTKASAPLNIEGQGSSGTSIDVSWRKPLSDGGTPINGYTVRAYAVSKKNMETGEYESIEPELDTEGNKIIAAEVADVIGTSCTVKGLKTEYGYVFEVCAVTSAGEGEIGTSEPATTHTKPSKPTILAVESGVGSAATLPLTVTWTAPEDDGNSDIIGYDVYVGGFPMNKGGMISADDRSYTFEDNRVKSGKTYKVTVRAYNAVSTEGVESDPMSIKVGTVPAPKNVQVSGDADGNIFVTWPIDQYKDIMSYIEKYVVYVDGEMFASTANNKDNNMTAELQELGVKHKVEVAVLSTMGEGNKSIPVYITLGTTDKIQNVSAVAGKQSIKLAWDKPVVQTTSLNPSSYTVYANDKVVKTIQASDLDAADNKVKTELTNLEGGKEYTITVTATNRYGESVPSEAVKAKPWADPDAPKVDNIKPALGEFSFTFKDGSGRGAEITDHNVYLDGNKLEAGAYTIEGDKVTVKNVTNGGTGHKFYITAITAINGGICESAKPDPEYTVITGVPLVPGNVKAIAGVASATIAFDKSEDISPEHPVTKYNIYKIENGVETLLTSVSAEDENGNIPERYSYVVSGLTNGTEYSFSVSALNDLGESEHCGVSVKPGTPTAPEIESVTPSSGKLEVKWSEPESSNAGAITKYGVYLNGVLAKTTPETSMLIKDLENGSEYVITVSAFNYVGEGEKSAPVTATPGGPPDKIRDIAYELTYNETDKCGVELTWKAPEDTGGLDITSYKVTGEGNIVITGRKAVITGLERGTDYTWDIIACSAAGDGDAVTTETITTLDKPGAPTLVGVDSSNSEFTLTWKAPSEDGRSKISAYNFYFKPVDGGEEIVWTLTTIPDPDKNGEMSASVNADTLEGLVVGQKYEIAVTAVNAVDESERSTSTRTTLNDALEQKKPGAPTNVKASKGDAKITLSWSAPLSDGNSTITSYVIWTGTSEDNLGYLATVSGHTFSYEHTGLTNGTERFYKVKAVNGVDADGGPFSEVVSETPVKINAPSKPEWVAFDDAAGKTAYETSASGDTMTFRWTESQGDELGGTISYEVYINGNLMKTTEGLEYVLSAPTNSTRYNVQIKAVNEVGGEALSDYLYAYKNLNIRKGSASDGYEYDEAYKDNVFANIDSDYDGEEDNKPIYSKPGSPENVALEQSKTEANAILTWEPPKDNGNKEINGYKAYITFNGKTEVVQLDAEGNVAGKAKSRAQAIRTQNDEETLYEYVFGITYGKAYTVQMKAVNEIGDSDPSLPVTLYSFPETPSAFKAEVENKKDIVLEWQLVSQPTSFTLYINGKPQSEKIDVNAVEATKDDNSDFTTYRYTYSANLNETYYFQIAANFESQTEGSGEPTIVESAHSDGIEVSTKEVQANAPTIATAAANGEAIDNQYRVTLTWTAPDNINDANVDADSYIVYVNGQEYTGKFYVGDTEVEKIPADAMSVDIEGIYDKSLIKIAAVSTSGTVGKVSEPFTFNAVGEQTFEPGTPGKPEFTAANCELQKENGVLLNENNLVISWKSAAISEDHTVKASKFEIYFGRELIDTVEADAADTEDAQYDYTRTLTVKAGTDYNIRIVPVFAGDDGDKPGPEASAVLRVPGYAEPSKPNLTATLSEDKTTISLAWTDDNDLSNVKYIVTVNGTDMTDYVTEKNYEYTVEEDVTDYVFSVTAVRTYDLGDGNVKETTAKSNNAQVTITGGGGGGEDENTTTNSNKPVITKTLSNGGVGGGIKVKVYWDAPTDRLENEVGDIYKYSVVADDEVIGTVLVKNDDGSLNPLQFEITTFTSLEDTANVVIRAIKEVNGQDIISAASKAWVVSPKYNVQNDKDKYDGDDDTDADHKNTTGEDKEDEEQSFVTLPIVANVTGKVKVTVTDNFDKSVEVEATLDDNGQGEAKINEADVKDGDRTFAIKISQDACTTYTITGVKYADFTNAKLKELMEKAELYVGDLNGDGKVNNADKGTLSGNINKPNMTVLDGDLNGDGKVNNADMGQLTANMNKQSSVISYSK